MPLSVSVDAGTPYLWVAESAAGVVVEPGEDLDVGAICEAVVREVGLPGFVGLVGLEADVRGFRFLGGFGCDEFSTADDAVDRRAGQVDAMVMVEVPSDRVGASVEALCGEGSAELHYELGSLDRGCLGSGASGT